MAAVEDAEVDTLEIAVELLDSLEAVAQELWIPAGDIVESPKGTHKIDELASCLSRVMNVINDLGGIEAALLEAVEREKAKSQVFVPLPDSGAMELMYTAGSKKWKTESLKPVVIHAIVDKYTDEDGELTKTPEELLRELLAMVGVSYWKVTELDHYGIDANDYTTKAPGKFKVRVHTT